MLRTLNWSYTKLQDYLKYNRYLIFTLSIVAMCAYGFELFNFNLTIDEEIHATYASAIREWISQGRWGMYILNRLLLPHTIIPFVPLFLALVFHICAVLLLIESWEIAEYTHKLIIGAIGITFPITAYMYTFATINYGIGAGFFCIATSLFLYANMNDYFKLLAIFPAAFAIGIYQGFFPALAAVYLIYILRNWMLLRAPSLRGLGMMLSIHILAIFCYESIQKGLLTLSGAKETGYISSYIKTGDLLTNLFAILARIMKTLFMVYSGDSVIYATKIPFLSLLIFSLFIGLALHVRKSDLSLASKLFIVFLALVLLLLPFASGIILQGYLAMRFLVAAPVVMMGIFALGSDFGLPGYKFFISLVSVICIFQFIVSTNYLFGSSHLALQADRIMAAQLIEEIESAKALEGTPSIKYLDVVGYHSRPTSPLIPKTETFGASFFEWDQGNPGRILLFLKTLGYYDELRAAPIEKRVQMIEYSLSMPDWPEKGSIKIVDDVVLIKFGPYSDTQRMQICSSKHPQFPLQDQGFCK